MIATTWTTQGIDERGSCNARGFQQGTPDGIVTCPWHHSRAHDTSYDMTRLPTGRYGLHRRT
jgi:hypothetical protein